MPPQHHVGLGVGEGLSGGRADPLLDDVDPGRHLGHAVLHLHARVHLQEEVLLALQQALDGARPDVVDGARRLHADRADAGPQLLAHDPLRRRGLLDQLLVAALDRAVALAQVDHVAVAVGEHLHLHVARVRQVALQVHRGVGEELLAFARGALEGVLQLLLGERHPEPLATATTGRLHGHREAELPLGDLERLLERRHGLRGPGHDRHPCGLHELTRTRLRAHRLDGARGRPDEHDAGLLARGREARVLGEEAVAGMDRLRARPPGDLDDLLDVQVVLCRRAGAEVVGLPGARHVARLAVELRVDRHGLHVQLLRRPDDPQRDLAAVGYQDLLEHRARGRLVAAPIPAGDGT